MNKESFQNALGLALRSARKDAGLTQGRLAAKAGISIPTVRLLERGRGTLSSWVLVLEALKLKLHGRNLPNALTVGEQVAQLRHRRGIGQRGLCKLIQVSQPTLVQLERRNRGRLSTLDRALGVLGAGPRLLPVDQKVRFYTHTATSSAHHGWNTPEELLQALYTVFGRFDLDPCSPSANARKAPVRARLHYTVEDDGLSLPWHGTVFVNPPYGRSLPEWTTKAKAEFIAGRAQVVVAIVPARTDTRWWHADIAGFAHVLFLRGRLAFGNSGQSAPFPSALVVWGGNPEQLASLQSALPTAWIPGALATATAAPDTHAKS